jgi:hypothetical protein
MKKVIVRWTATYETVMEVSDNATKNDIMDEAANITIDVPGSTYQEDTWEVEKIT